MILYKSLLKNCFLIFPVNSKQSWSFTTERGTSQNILLYKLIASKSKFQLLAFFPFFVKKTVPQSKNRVIIHYYTGVFRIVQRTVEDVAEILKVYYSKIQSKVSLHLPLCNLNYNGSTYHCLMGKL